MKQNISRNPLWPDWYNGKKSDEVQFGRAFLEQWPLKCVNGTLYTLDGPVEDESEIKQRILENIEEYVTSGPVSYTHLMQVSRSKKWASKPLLDDAGKPVLQKSGKPVLKKSYSVLQDDFFNYMRNAGYTDVERGERGSTEEHLTVTQFKVQREQERLDALTAQADQKAQSLAKTSQTLSKKEKELAAVQKLSLIHI